MNYKKASLFLAAGLTLFRLFYINNLPLLGDEAYYWQWSRHLDFGYYEQGPGIAFVIWLFTLFGSITSVFTVRLGAVILSFFTMLLVLSICRRIYPEDKEEKSGFFALLLINSAVVYAAGAVLMMHDTVMAFFYALFLRQAVIIAAAPAPGRSWMLAGLYLGFGVISKYTLAIIFPAFILFLFAAGGVRNNVKRMLVFTLFFILALLPVIYWNLANDFASVKYLLIRKGSSSAFTFKYFLELIGSQAGLNSPLLIPFFAAAARNSFKRRGPDPKFLFSFLFVASFAPFILLSLNNRVEANWPAFTFLPLFILAAGFSITTAKKRFFHFAYSFGLIITVIIYLQAAFGIFPLPERSNPLLKASGYKELAARAWKAKESLPDAKDIFWAARHYQAASLLAFHLPGRPDVHILLSHESSKNYRFWRKFSELESKNCLYLWSEPWENYEMSEFFERLDSVHEIGGAVSEPSARNMKLSYFISMKGAK